MASTLYRLWAFHVANRTIFTRGRSLAEAQEYLERHFASVRPLRDCPIDAALLYSMNHASGWLSRPPVWLVEAGRVQPEETSRA